MSLRSLLMPLVSRRLLSRERLLARRERAERERRARGEPHRVHYFHQVDDPYGALAASALPQLAVRYDVELVPHLVGPPPDAAAPQREMLVAYSRRDAQLLAARTGLRFRDPGAQPDAAAIARASALLVGAADAARFVELAGPVSEALWEGCDPERFAAGLAEPATAQRVASHLEQSGALRQRLGHYLGATFFYGGEWYWGIDRLHHLEERLQALGAQRAGVAGAMFPPEPDLREPVALADPPAIDFFVSLRSPYSAIVVPRVFELARLTGAPLRLRFVLPMVMRGLPVPREKRAYISQDAAREAFVRGIPFGCVNDPVGRPTERGLAVLAWAERAGRGQAFLASFMQGVWAEGIDAGSDRGLRRISERAGLDWADARQALRDEGWRDTAERNREEMFALGLWGVPSFRVGETAVWGQDRLWAVRQAVLAQGRSGMAGTAGTGGA